MDNSFYQDITYRNRQAEITRKNWEKGVFDFKRKRQERACKRIGCGNNFEVIPSDPKIYCSSTCAAVMNNAKRGPMTPEQKMKLSKVLTGRSYPERQGVILIPRDQITCGNAKCARKFLSERWMHRKYCSVKCHMVVTGGRPTSPKASKGKGGIRKDISNMIYFYSRWEANYARILNYLTIKWEYAPRTFDLGTQNYTPDFYLPEKNLYVEVKNFLWKYSKERDEKFRLLYPDVKLKLLLKDEYLELENKYAKLLPNWEYKNSPTPS